MTTAARVLTIARDQLGTTEQPPGSNRTKYGRAFGMDGYPWCAMFTWWVFRQAHGNDDLHPEIAWTPGLAQWFREQDRFGSTPRVGAVAFFDFPDSVDRIQHVGIVEAVRNDGDIQTIEGNTSPGNSGSQANGGGVYRRTRDRGLVVMYGYPRFTAPRPKPTFTLKRTLHEGHTGGDVRALQDRIGVKDDGIFGPRTENAVRAYQHRKGLVVDGVVGPKTARSLGWTWAG